ncbi:MAG: ferrous iron transport protein A [Spartobacteria bacterium]|nr:ferrous iron transport protein A [Spartobacteria bacterium]
MNEKKLTDLKVGDKAVLLDIGGCRRMRSRLVAMGLHTDAAFTVVAAPKDELGGPVIISVEGSRTVLGWRIASRIAVRMLCAFLCLCLNLCCCTPPSSAPVTSCATGLDNVAQTRVVQSIFCP